nr:RNA-directed DNA polymerase, eukaryota, reverse transcriptase zinc-binding domain protein [Tanacetum cinerariifolium]
MTCWVRAIEEPCWVPDFEEDGEEGYDVNDGSHEDDMYGGVSENLKDVEGESDREEVHETNFEEVPDQSIFKENSIRKNDVYSEDPFDIYEVLNKKRDGKNIDDKHKDSLKYLHGFTPNEEGDVLIEKVDNWSDENRVNEGKKDRVCEGQHVHERVEVSNDTHESTCSGHFKKSEVPHKGGSILDLIDDLINVRQTMGYDMTRRIKNMEEIIESKGNWDGKVVIMGDFNELCDISERFGSFFNKHGAEAFNSFIVNAGLVEVPLEQTWLEANVNDQNSYSKFMNKHKYLKEKIRIWTRLPKESLNSRKSILKVDLADLNGVIDKGEGLDADGHRSREVVRLIQEEEKRGRLTIRGVLVDGIWMESPHLVKHEFFEHFKNRFEKPNKSRIFLERDFVKRISWEQNDDLERKVSNEEIKRAVWDCGIDKAPGPDSFTFGFYQRYWDIIDLIVLLGVCIKLLLRFCHRLVTVLDDIFDEIQSAFVTDRQILDGAFILNEIVHWCKNKKKQSMIFKVDFEKVYDSVIWDFIDDILRRSVLERNGGDSLSPFLFMLVMKSLHVSFQRVVDAGLFNGIKSDSSLQISHLFYADEAIFIDVNSKKPSWVRWKSVLAAKDVGGLGESSLFALNQTLMFKWVWRFVSQKNSLCVRVVKALHGGDGNIGNEANTLFWDVAWCGDTAFKNLVPRLYALESMKNIEVTSKLSHGGLKFSFRRNPSGGVEQA